MSNMLRTMHPGTAYVVCAHFTGVPLDPNQKIVYDDEVVNLVEIPGETGRHGECSKCGIKYFSQKLGEVGA